MQKTVCPIPVDKDGKILCEISDGNVSLPTVEIKENFIAAEAWKYLRNWGIEANISLPAESYMVKNLEIFVIERNNWKMFDSSPSRCFVGKEELADIFKGSKKKSLSYQIILAALCLQKANKDLEKWANEKFKII